MNKIISFASLLLLSTGLLLSSCGPTHNHWKKKGSVKSVLVLGNSIVQHGPAPNIGWNGNWGMAASAVDSDFVHRLTAEIHIHDTSVKVTCANLVGLEWRLGDYNFGRLDSFSTPDMLIMRFGENVNDTTVVYGGFIGNYDRAIRHIDPDDKAIKVVVSSFWLRPATNKLLQQYAHKKGYIYVRNDDLLADSTNSAYGLFTEKGVAEHPSDKGMRRIKERIWEQIAAYF